MEKIVVIGSGGHAHSVVDSIERGQLFEIAGFVEPKSDENYTYHGYRIIGTDDDLQEIYRQGIKNAFVGIGYLGKGCIRDQLYEKLKAIGFALPAVIDSTAVVSDSAVIKEGAFVGKNAVVNAGASVGKMAIINTGAIVEHDASVGDFSHIAVSAVLCGEVCIGTNALVGANATILQCRKTGNYAIIGAGAIVTKDVGDNIKWIGTKECYE